MEIQDADPPVKSIDSQAQLNIHMENSTYTASRQHLSGIKT